MNAELKNDRMIRALLRQPVDMTPVWIMRQAGRYLPEYRATREKAGDFITLCKTPELACEVTLQPLARFPLDAAILFSDILTIPDAMGLGLSIVEKQGPQFARPVRSKAEIEKLAKQGATDRFTFPRPMTSKPGLDFSFSGLKTHTRNTLAAIERPTDQDKADIARAFQDAAIDTIRIKCERSLISTRLPSLVIAGGVSANQSLRKCLAELAIKHNVEIFYPELKFCTDNGAMIAYTGALRLKNVTTQNQSIQVRPRWPMTELEAISP